MMMVYQFELLVHHKVDEELLEVYWPINGDITLLPNKGRNYLVPLSNGSVDNIRETRPGDIFTTTLHYMYL